MTLPRPIRDIGIPGVVALAGPLAAVGAAAVLRPATDWLGNANVALLLVVVIVAAAAFGGRVAGAATSATAAIAFNAIHTRPYGSLTIDRREDIVTTVLLLAVGLAVGEITHRRLRSDRNARRRTYTVQRVHRIAELVANDTPLDELLGAIDAELSAELGLRSMRLELGTGIDPGHGVLRPSGIVAVAGETTDCIPPAGIDLAVRHRGRVLGTLHMSQRRAQPLTHEQHVLAIASADLLGAALAGQTERSPDR